jgi:hypothetical protein
MFPDNGDMAQMEAQIIPSTIWLLKMPLSVY